MPNGLIFKIISLRSTGRSDANVDANATRRDAKEIAMRAQDSLKRRAYPRQRQWP